MSINKAQVLTAMREAASSQAKADAAFAKAEAEHLAIARVSVPDQFAEIGKRFKLDEESRADVVKLVKGAAPQRSKAWHSLMALYAWGHAWLADARKYAASQSPKTAGEKFDLERSALARLASTGDAKPKPVSKAQRAEAKARGILASARAALKRLQERGLPDEALASLAKWIDTHKA